MLDNTLNEAYFIATKRIADMKFNTEQEPYRSAVVARRAHLLNTFRSWLFKDSHLTGRYAGQNTSSALVSVDEVSLYILRYISSAVPSYQEV